jgi:hypothetical protein
MKKLAFAALALAVLSGCASVPKGDPAQDAALKTFQVAPDQAGIYIYRNESMGAAVTMDVAIDGQPVGQTGANTYLYKQVTPGKHTVTSSAENTDTLDVDVQPGSLVYIWQEVKMGMISARTKLHEVSETQGKSGVGETSLAASR